MGQDDEERLARAPAAVTMRSAWLAAIALSLWARTAAAQPDREPGWPPTDAVLAVWPLPVEARARAALLTEATVRAVLPGRPVTLVRSLGPPSPPRPSPAPPLFPDLFPALGSCIDEARAAGGDSREQWSRCFTIHPLTRGDAPPHLTVRAERWTEAHAAFVMQSPPGHESPAPGLARSGGADQATFIALASPPLPTAEELGADAYASAMVLDVGSAEGVEGFVSLLLQVCEGVAFSPAPVCRRLAPDASFSLPARDDRRAVWVRAAPDEPAGVEIEVANSRDNDASADAEAVVVV